MAVSRSKFWTGFSRFLCVTSGSKSIGMLEFCKQILLKVSFDRQLFRKELKKMIGMLKKEDVMVLKAWCIVTFVQHQDVVSEVFQNI